MKYYIQETKDFGRGLYADRLMFPSDIVAVCEIIPLTPKDTETLESTGLKYYKFKMNESQDCIVLGDGSLFNHAAKPNVSFSLERDHTGRYRMIFRTRGIVKKGTQLFIDYTADCANIKIEEYFA